MNALAPYRKTLASLIGAVVTWAGAVVISAPEAITSAEWYALAVALATIVTVYLVPNDNSAEVDAAVSAVYREVNGAKFPPLPEPDGDA